MYLLRAPGVDRFDALDWPYAGIAYSGDDVAGSRLGSAEQVWRSISAMNVQERVPPVSFFFASVNFQRPVLGVRFA